MSDVKVPVYFYSFFVYSDSSNKIIIWSSYEYFYNIDPATMVTHTICRLYTVSMIRDIKRRLVASTFITIYKGIGG